LALLGHPPRSEPVKSPISFQNLQHPGLFPPLYSDPLGCSCFFSFSFPDDMGKSLQFSGTRSLIYPFFFLSFSCGANPQSTPNRFFCAHKMERRILHSTGSNRAANSFSFLPRGGLVRLRTGSHKAVFPKMCGPEWSMAPVS